MRLWERSGATTGSYVVRRSLPRAAGRASGGGTGARGGAGRGRLDVPSSPPVPVPLSFALPPFWCRRAAAGKATLLALGLARPVPRTARKTMDVLGWLLLPLLLLCTQPHHGAR